MSFPREVLNELKWHPDRSLENAEIAYELKWHPDRSLENAEIAYEHRGAPNDLEVIPGSEISELGRSFFITRESRIPYHRIRRIRVLSPGGEIVRSWEFD